MYPPRVTRDAKRLDAQAHIRAFEFHVFAARVFLAECAIHRYDPRWRDSYWMMFSWAQHARQRATADRALVGFGVELYV
ncbi:hypothetical protein AB4Y36_38295 [Paraburkholderia sp. BR10936]|uniref:hypothetical protein n=1 Tax=Paraburkholderia sp. BR10936 TaxID=3236993 RepID=UPI0034D20056